MLFCAALVITGERIASSDTHAATITLTPFADTTLMELTPFNNLGAVQSLAVGVTGHGTAARGLIRFELAGRLSAGAVVTEATLALPVIRESSQVEEATFDLHRMKVAWGEGNKTSPGGGVSGTGSAATAGEATWVARLHGQTLWSIGGAGSVDDYESEASANASVGGSVSFSSTPSLVADVQSWVSDPASNFGWLIKDAIEADSSITARRLGSKEHPTDKPSLTITYTEAVTITHLAIDGANLCFSFQASDGKRYSIERRELIGSGNWEVIQTLPANASRIVRFCEPIGTGTAFYRVAEQ